MQTEIKMETRACKNCGSPFKVMVGSPQSVCSTACAAIGTRGPGGLWKASKKSDAATVSESVSGIVQTDSTENEKAPKVSVGAKQTKNGSDSKPKSDMKPIRSESMLDVKSGERPIAHDTTRTKEEITTSEELKMLKKNDSDETEETLPALSDDSQKNLEKAGLDSMTLLSRSANKLMRIMDACVTDSDLDRANDGGARIDSHRGDQAIQCANAIAHTIQTQVNMVKAMTAFMKPKKK